MEFTGGSRRSNRYNSESWVVECWGPVSGWAMTDGGGREARRCLESSQALGARLAAMTLSLLLVLPDHPTTGTTLASGACIFHAVDSSHLESGHNRKL